jgi:hypothetical protein
MKKIYFTFITIASSMSFSAQTLTQANNAPANGDQYGTKQCDSLISPGAAGANAVWNFSNLNIRSSIVANYSTVATTAPGYPLGSQATGSSLNDLVYTLSSATDLKYYGGNIKVATVNAQLTYSSAAVYGSYPTNLNTTASSVIGGSINVTAPQAASGSFTGNSTLLADGTGTLILPGVGGTYTNVIRVLTTQTLNFAVGPLGFITGSIIFNTYNYYTPSIKAALLTIAVKTVTSSLLPASTQSIVTINKDYITSLQEKTNVLVDLSIYPNPAPNYLNFSTDNLSQKNILIYDITGKLVDKQNFNSGKLKLDVSSYNNGFYLYSILNTAGEVLKTNKFVVNH